MRKSGFLRAVAVVATVAAHSVAHARSFTVVALGQTTFSGQLNDRGHYVATRGGFGGDGPERAVLWRGDQPELDLFPNGLGVAVNARDQVVGYVEEPPSYHARMVLWERGRVTSIGEEPSPEYGVFPSAINFWGQVAGEVFRSSDGASQAFLWSGGQQFPLAGEKTFADDLNDFGAVVGMNIAPGAQAQARLWIWGKSVDLGALGTGRSEAYAINNLFQIVGESRMTPTGDFHAFLWEAGRMTDLVAAGHEARAFDINDRGEIVGEAWLTDDSFSQSAVLWDHGQMIVLQDTVSLPDWHLDHAVSINNAGQIVVSARSTIPNVGYSDFLLTPVKEQ